MTFAAGQRSLRGDNPHVLHHLSNVDLHCHSEVSDGTLTPEALAWRARDHGVACWALTDHDEVDGLARARAAAREHGLPFLTGTELSVTFAGVTVHIVGLGFDPDHPALNEGLRRIRAGRETRARAMADGLASVGIRGAFEGACRYVSNPDLISRTHFARFLVERGICLDTSEVFRHYLVEGKPGYVPHEWAKLGDAVRWIVDAGGLAVIAHPARYRFSPTAEYALFSEFKEHGGEGVEVITGSHSSADALKYAETAREFGLYASRGSDFHAPGESRCDLGQLPDLPGKLEPVWMPLLDRVIWPERSTAAA